MNPDECQQSGRPRWADHKVMRSRSSWLTQWNPSLLKIQKISLVWWHTTVVPATQEAEAGESLEPGRQRLQWANMVPLHSISKEKKILPHTITRSHDRLSASWGARKPVLVPKLKNLESDVQEQEASSMGERCRLAGSPCLISPCSSSSFFFFFF